ncbi:hypothetical protein C8R45DRAFT_1212768 [Mycena sanguinolenta]|nr:hypothetical protein C8R45DRAFT_1212768 [Mycena sanguinolenta]
MPIGVVMVQFLLFPISSLPSFSASAHRFVFAAPSSETPPKYLKYPQLMNGEQLDGAPSISTSRTPTSPAAEWASRTNEMLDSTPDGSSPGPRIPGAFPEGEADSGDANIGETLASVKAGMVGYFGLGSNVEASQEPDSNLNTTASASSLSTARIEIHEPDSSSEAGSHSPHSTTTSLDVFPGSTQSLGIFAESTPTLASCEATENAPISPNIPPTPNHTPVLGSMQRNEYTHHPYIHAVMDERGFVSSPLTGDSSYSPFTPIPPVDPAVPYFPVSLGVPAQLETNGNTHNLNAKAHELLTHAGTHANGHTDAEDAQRAAFTHGIQPEEAAAGHVFTAQGVHVPATLGAAQVAHAGAFVEERNHFKDNEYEDEREGNSKREGKASRFVAKLKGKMHVG